jgi:hypothetical protein
MASFSRTNYYADRLWGRELAAARGLGLFRGLGPLRDLGSIAAAGFRNNDLA